MEPYALRLEEIDDALRKKTLLGPGLSHDDLEFTHARSG
jgi:hypothetical protein